MCNDDERTSGSWHSHVMLILHPLQLKVSDVEHRSTTVAIEAIEATMVTIVTMVIMAMMPTTDSIVTDRVVSHRN